MSTVAIRHTKAIFALLGLGVTLAACTVVANPAPRPAGYYVVEPGYYYTAPPRRHHHGHDRGRRGYWR